MDYLLTNKEKYHIEDYTDTMEDCVFISENINIQFYPIDPARLMSKNCAEYILSVFNLNNDIFNSEYEDFSEFRKDTEYGRLLKALENNVNKAIETVRLSLGKSKIKNAEIMHILSTSEGNSCAKLLELAFGYYESEILLGCAKRDDAKGLKRVFPNYSKEAADTLIKFINYYEGSGGEIKLTQKIDENNIINILDNVPEEQIKKETKPLFKKPLSVKINSIILTELISKRFSNEALSFMFGYGGEALLEDNCFYAGLSDIGNDDPLSYFMHIIAEIKDNLNTKEEFVRLDEDEQRELELLNRFSDIVDDHYDLIANDVESAEILLTNSDEYIRYQKDTEEVVIHSKEFDLQRKRNKGQFDSRWVQYIGSLSEEDKIRLFELIKREYFNYLTICAREDNAEELLLVQCSKIQGDVSDIINTCKQLIIENKEAVQILDKPDHIEANGKIFVSTYLNDFEERELATILSRCGAVYSDRVEKYAEYLIVRNEMAFKITDKVEAAIKKQNNGDKIQIIPIEHIRQLDKNGMITGSVQHWFDNLKQYLSYPKSIDIAKSEFLLTEEWDYSKDVVKKARAIIKRKKGKIADRMKNNLYVLYPENLYYVSRNLVVAIHYILEGKNVKIVNYEHFIKLSEQMAKTKKA